MAERWFLTYQVSHPHVADTVTHVSVPKTATVSDLAHGKSLTQLYNRGARTIADVVSTCGMHTFKSRLLVLQKLLKQWSQDKDVAITVLVNSLEEEEVDKDMDVAVTKVDAEVDDDDVEPDEAAQGEDDDAAVSADMEAMEVESEEGVDDTAEHVEVAIEAVDSQTVEAVHTDEEDDVGDKSQHVAAETAEAVSTDGDSFHESNRCVHVVHHKGGQDMGSILRCDSSRCKFSSSR